MNEDTARWRLAAIDEQTGEVLEHPGELGIYDPRSKTRPEAPYAMVFTNRLYELAEQNEPGARLTGVRARVLIWMLARTEYYHPERGEIGCVVPGRQADIAEDLDLDSGQVSKAVRWLKAQHVIREAEDWSGSGWEIDLRLVWRGELQTREKQKRKQMEKERRDHLELVEDDS